MPGVSPIDEKRKELLPIVARAFAEAGHRRATTAELALRCEVRENILYRLRPDKKTVFIASLDHVYEQDASTWRQVLSKTDNAGAAMRLLEPEAEHYGESGLHRIIFSARSEIDEPESRETPGKTHGRFHRFIRGQVAAHRNGARTSGLPDGAVSAWAIVDLGKVASIGRELGLLTARRRERMFREAGRMMLDVQGRRSVFLA